MPWAYVSFTVVGATVMQFGGVPGWNFVLRITQHQNQLAFV